MTSPKPDGAAGGGVARPEFVVHTDSGTVADALNGFLQFATTGLMGETQVDIASAYFNPSGYALLADNLDRAAGVRLLLGAEPDPGDRRLRSLKQESADPGRAQSDRLRRALEGHDRTIVQDRDLLGFTSEADRCTRRLVEWLGGEGVQVRRLEDRFLHAKAFIVGADGHGVVAGSSNFTMAGLTKNVELNLGNYSPALVSQVHDWFSELWDAAADYDLAAVFSARFEEHPPELIYLRMLWERYGGELEAEQEASGQTKIHLTGFQRDGLWRAQRILKDHHGVLIADEVGLGKTFLAGELIREAAEERRQRVLVVAPATLRDGIWRAFRERYRIWFEIRSFEDLAGDYRRNPDRKPGSKPDSKISDYAMVVVDEAHNLRNPSTQRAAALRKLLAGSPPKSLVLLTATPVNNSLWDLYHQLGYFLRNDAVFADAIIPSLRNKFAVAMALNPDDLTPKQLFDILDLVMVRRTRSFVKRFYSNDQIEIDGESVQIVFPTPRVHKVSYDIDSVLPPGFFDRFAHALDVQDDSTIKHNKIKHNKAGADPEVLSLARYTPSRYRRDGDRDSYEAQLAGLLRSGLLKRFESSPHAFAKTCERMANNHDAFLSLLDNGKVATGEALADWVATDSDDIEDVDNYLDAHLGLVDDASGYDVAKLTAHVKNDRDLLKDFASQAGAVTRTDDPTLAAVVAELVDISAQAAAEGIGGDEIRDKRKVLIFSYFTDTVDWITEHLEAAVADDARLAPYKGRIASISGRPGPVSKEDVLWGFAPKTTDPPEGRGADKFDIVVTTDVLAEGVNLQQARHIINYDLPWNPMRLVQRHGRIDRIGSNHAEVFIRCVFPDERLDDLLGLEDRLRRKLQQAAASVGVSEVLPDQTRVDLEFTETREEIERLRREENSLFERGGTTKGAISGEEYRQELRRALEDEPLAARILELPWGSGSGMRVNRSAASEQPGFVFCVRIGDWSRPLFRYVELVDGGAPIVKDDALSCLDYAKPPDGFDTPRALDDETYNLAFDAWEVGLDHIVENWNRYADKANLEPKVRRVLVQAAEIVRSNPPPTLDQTQIDALIDTIQAPYPERTIRLISAAVRSSDDPAEQAKLIHGVIKDSGLEPFVPPEPLPEITPDDVHLVCWIALTQDP